MMKQIYNNRLFIVFVAPFFLGLSTVFTFEPFNYTLLNFIILPFFFLLISFINRKSRGIYRKKPYLSNLFFVGYSFGVGFFLSGTFWISYSLTYDANFQYLIPFSIIFFPIFLGLFFGLASLLIGSKIENDIYSVLLFCSSFALIDFIRSKILSGFPWNLWAYSWSWFPETLQIVNIIGLFAFNLLTLTIFCLPLLLIFKNKKINIPLLFIFLIFFFSNYLFGSFIINKQKKILFTDNNYQINLVNFKIVSPNFDLEYDLNLDQVEKKILKLVKYSDPQKEKKTIFVWPEGVFSGYNFSEISKFKSLIKKNFSKNHLIIFGINKIDQSGNNYNSLLVVDNDFNIQYQYNKKKLVPFGEFLPLEKYLNYLGVKKITEGYGSFAKGIEQNNFQIRDINILPLICYEIIFTELVQNKNNRSNLIVNISEDAWFGGTIGPHQHFAKSKFRAIENGTYVIRSANQGISAFINNNGIVIKRLEPYETGNLESNIPLINNSNKNKNDLIFFILLFTYSFIFFTLRNK